MIEPAASAPWWHRDFHAVVRRSDPATLAYAATLLAAHGSGLLHDETDVHRTLSRVDELAGGVSHGDVESWRRHLFVECGFAGNGSDYHDARNSFLPDVIERRVGIPISLAVVAIGVARRAGLDVWGVGMPGHFLLGCVTAAGPMFVDPFNGGELLTATGCAERFAALFGSQRPFDPDYLLPTPRDAILVRMLANLKAIYARSRDLEGLTAVLRLRTCLPEASLDEQRELIRLLDATGHWTDAAAALDQVEAERPNDRMLLQLERDRLSARLN